MNTPTATNGLTFLRPYLFNPTPLKHNRIYLRLFNTSCTRKQAHRVQSGNATKPTSTSKALKVARDESNVEERVQALSAANALNWPRIQNSRHDLTVTEYLDKYQHLKTNESAKEDVVVVRGRLTSLRLAGSKLAFFDLVQDYMRVQVVCNFSKVAFAGVSQKDFRNFFRLLQRGDIICKIGFQQQEVKSIVLTIPSCERATISNCDE